MDIVKNALDIHDTIANDLQNFGGVLRCSVCGYQQELDKTSIARYIAKGWPEHCGQTMSWITQEQFDEEKANAPVEPVRKSRKHNPFHDSTLEKMQELYEYIVKFHKQNGYSPSFKEMAEYLYDGRDQRGNAHTLVNRLIDAGFLERKATGARMIFPAAKPPRKVFYKRSKK